MEYNYTAIVFVCKKNLIDKFKEIYNNIQKNNSNGCMIVVIIDNDLLNYSFCDIDKDIMIKYYPESNYKYIFDSFFKFFWKFVLYIDLNYNIEHILNLNTIFSLKREKCIIEMKNMLLFDTSIIPETEEDQKCLIQDHTCIKHYFTKNNFRWIKYEI